MLAVPAPGVPCAVGICSGPADQRPARWQWVGSQWWAADARGDTLRRKGEPRMFDFTDWVPCITCSRKAPALAVSYVTVKLPSPLSRAATLKTPAPSASATRGVPDGGAATARSEKAYEFVLCTQALHLVAAVTRRSERCPSARRPATSFRNSTKAGIAAALLEARALSFALASGAGPASQQPSSGPGYAHPCRRARGPYVPTGVSYSPATAPSHRHQPRCKCCLPLIVTERHRASRASVNSARAAG